MPGLYLRQPDPSLWEKFCEGRAPSHADPLIARWTRARALGVSPEGSLDPRVLTAQEVRLRRERLEPLLCAAHDIMVDAAAELARHHYSLLIADPHGVIVERFRGGDFEPIAQEIRLVTGAAWSEASRGTNAIGTALAEGGPVAVEGFAHWERNNHRLSCYASLIRDPDGEVVAIVDATSRSEASSSLTALAIKTLATHVESTLARQVYDAAGGLDAVVRTLERYVQPTFLMERGGRVRAANAGGRRWLTIGAQRHRPLKELWKAAESGRTQVSLAHDALSIEPVRTAGHRIFAALVFVEARSPPPVARPGDDPFRALAGSDARLAEQKSRAGRFARSDLPVLLLSETGTGKELMARAVHAASPRAAGPFVAVNCGGISEALLESELFGHGPGAFTGARPGGASGRIEAAHRGTLFLDEIAELPARAQVSLLRVLEDGIFHRLGEVEPRHADVRLVAATCRDLNALVAEGCFRRDFYFRIRGATVTLPPLRARTDRRELARALVRALAPDAPPRLDADVIAHIETYDWPGNVRELKTALAHAIALDPTRIRVEHLPAGATSPDHHPDAPPGPTVRQSEVAVLDRALAHANGNMSEAARRLGVARSTLYRMMRRHGRR